MWSSTSFAMYMYNAQSKIHCFATFESMLYIPVNYFSVMSGCFLGCTSNNQRTRCLAQGHNTTSPLRLKPGTPRSHVKHSTTALLCSSNEHCIKPDERIPSNRGSYMSAYVLLNLLKELGKSDKMRGLPSILSLFRKV